jgi:subtilisin-like proprotein convertase family protein
MVRARSVRRVVSVIAGGALVSWFSGAWQPASAATTVTYSTGNIAAPIPDQSSVDIPINIPDNRSISHTTVYVRLNHTWDADLELRLVAPDQTEVPLAIRRGSSGDNYGTGNNDCTGSFTVFDDAASTFISAGTPPFAGTFIPEASLGLVNGKRTKGAWKLRVADTSALDVGTVGCVQFAFTSPK